MDKLDKLFLKFRIKIEMLDLVFKPCSDNVVRYSVISLCIMLAFTIFNVTVLNWDNGWAVMWTALILMWTNMLVHELTLKKTKEKAEEIFEMIDMLADIDNTPETIEKETDE